jgi:glycosyltransferase involved in cell wall biosynthesis
LSAFHCNPLWGSEAATGWNWAKELSNIGHEITVLTISEMRDYIDSPKLESSIDFQYIDLPSVRPQWVPGSMEAVPAYLRWQEMVLEYIRHRENEFDVAHHVTWGGLHLGSELWKLPVPLIYGPIGGGQTAPSKYWQYFGREWPVELLRTVATGPLLKANRRCRETIRNAAVTLVDNRDTAAACERLGAKDVRFMLSYGLSPAAIGPIRTQPVGEPVILYVGRLIARKGPRLAVEAFAQFRKSRAARLVIAGHGPLRGEIESLAEQHGVAADVQFLGNVAFSDVQELYDSASVLLFPSLRESFGAPILEALGRGLPVTALDLHGIADAQTGNAVEKVPLPAQPRDLPSRVAAALSRVLDDGNWESRSAAGIKFASDWLWPAKAVAMTELYHEVVR